MAAPSIYMTVIKKMTYRGNANEEWSNSYALSGTTPANSTAWRALFDALVAQEKTLYAASSSVVAGYGYDGIPSTGDHAIWSVDMTISPNTPVPGTLTGATREMSGDQAGWIRWGLDRFNTNGKRVYLRKYYHSGGVDTTNKDNLQASTISAYTAFGSLMFGTGIDSGKKLVDKDGNLPIGSGISPYVTTRTLKRRGKRPPT